LKYTHEFAPKHQGLTAEETTLQMLNQGVCTDVLKSTKEIREGK